MCKWNLQKFAEALAPALPLADSTAALEKYDGLFKGYYEEGMRRFGISFLESARSRALTPALVEASVGYPDLPFG